MDYHRLETDDDVIENTVTCMIFTFVTTIKFLLAIGLVVSQSIIIAIWGTYIILFYNNLTGESESIYNFVIAQTIIAYCISSGLSTETYNVKKYRQRSYSSSINIINFINLFLNIYAVVLYYSVSNDFKINFFIRK